MKNHVFLIITFLALNAMINASFAQTDENCMRIEIEQLEQNGFNQITQEFCTSKQSILNQMLFDAIREYNNCTDSAGHEITELENARFTGIENILNQGANPNGIFEQSTPIIYAFLHISNEKRLQKVVAVLKEHKADINKQDSHGATLLSLSLNPYTGHLGIKFTEFLLQLGANPNFVDQFGNTALYYALQRKDPTLINLFLDNITPQTLFARNKKGESIELMLSSQRKRYPQNRTYKKLSDMIEYYKAETQNSAEFQAMATLSTHRPNLEITKTMSMLLGLSGLPKKLNFSLKQITQENGFIMDYLMDEIVDPSLIPLREMKEEERDERKQIEEEEIQFRATQRAIKKILKNNPLVIFCASWLAKTK